MATSPDITRKSSTKWITGIATAASAVSAQGAFVQINLINNHVTASGGNSLNNELTGARAPIIGTGGGSAHPSTASGGDVVLQSIGFTSNPMSAPAPPATFSGMVNIQNPASFSPFQLGARSEIPNGAPARSNITFVDVPATGQTNVTPPLGQTGASRSGYIPVQFTVGSVVGSLPDSGGNVVRNGWIHVTAGGLGGALANPGDPSGSRGVTLNTLYWDNGGIVIGGRRDLSDLVAAVGGAEIIIPLGSTENGVFTPIPEPSGISLLALGAGGIALRRSRKKKTA